MKKFKNFYPRRKKPATRVAGFFVFSLARLLQLAEPFAQNRTAHYG